MKNYVPSHLKDMNRQIVYQIIKEKESTSKAELAKLTGISSPTVIKIVNFLIEKKLVIEVGQGDFSQSEVSVGRKPRMLKLNTGLMLSLIHISEPTRPERISYAVFCLKQKTYGLSYSSSCVDNS